jgi:hypothetical protein
VQRPEEDLVLLKAVQQEILQQLKEFDNKRPGSLPEKNITAKEFVAVVRIADRLQDTYELFKKELLLAAFFVPLVIRFYALRSW